MLYDLEKLLFLCEHIIKYMHVLGDFGLIAGRSLKKNWKEAREKMLKCLQKLLCNKKNCWEHVDGNMMKHVNLCQLKRLGLEWLGSLKRRRLKKCVFKLCLKINFLRDSEISANRWTTLAERAKQVGYNVR